LEKALHRQIVDSDIVQFWVFEKPFKLLGLVGQLRVGESISRHKQTYNMTGVITKDIYEIRSKLCPSGLIPSEMAYLIPVKMPIEIIGSRIINRAKPHLRLRVRKFFLKSTLK
jgi:hypothetical protein